MLKVYSVFDSVSGSYGPLFLSTNDGVAMRELKGSIVPGNFLATDPGDYQLHCLASFDESKGTFEPMPYDQFLVIRVTNLVGDDLEKKRV